MTKLSPDQEVKIVAMREAGYTFPIIAERNGCSLSSAKRVCNRYSASKGALAHDIIDEAKANLRRSISSDDSIQEIAASMVLDTRFHCEQIREKLIEAANKLEINSSDDAIKTLRAINSYANALKLSTDAMRSALKIDTSTSIEEEELPILVMEPLTAEDIAEIRRQQAEQDAEMYGWESEEEEDAAEIH